MAVRPGDVVECRVESLAFGGRGVARIEGMAVFVERGLPGQTVRARILRAKKRFAEAQAVEVLTPSPDQVEPFCPHFGSCGGCQHQDLDYGRQLSWKERQAAEALRRIGKSRDFEVLPILASPRTTYYRNKMEFSFAGQGRHLVLGLREAGQGRRVTDLSVCHLQTERTPELLAMVRAFCRASGAAAFDPARGRGFWRKLVLRETGLGQSMAHLITAPDRKRFGAAAALGEALMAQGLTTFVHSTRLAPDDLAFGERRILTLGPGRVEETLCGVRYRLSPDAFFQTNTGAAELLYGAVRDLSGLTGPQTLLDLYCGAGGMALALAGSAARVIGVEAGEEAVADARETAAANGIANAEFVCADVEELSGALRDLPRPDAAVSDPPRAGMGAGAVAALLDLAPEVLVLVSCNPATLARDVERLAPTYALEAVRPVDLFPHTAHLECVARLRRT